MPSTAGWSSLPLTAGWSSLPTTALTRWFNFLGPVFSTAWAGSGASAGGRRLGATGKGHAHHPRPVIEYTAGTGLWARRHRVVECVAFGWRRRRGREMVGGAWGDVAARVRVQVTVGCCNLWEVLWERGR